MCIRDSAGADRGQSVGARGRDGGFRRRSAAGGAGNAGAGRAVSVRTARHVRGAVRGDRADRRTHAGRRAATRQPRATPCAGHATGTGCRSRPAARHRRGFPGRIARGRFRRTARRARARRRGARRSGGATARLAAGDPRRRGGGRKLQGTRAGGEAGAGRRRDRRCRHPRRRAAGRAAGHDIGRQDRGDRRDR